MIFQSPALVLRACTSSHANAQHQKRDGKVPHHIDRFSAIDRVYSSLFSPTLRSVPLHLVSFPTLAAGIGSASADAGIPSQS
jgi:hypothetical protein